MSTSFTIQDIQQLALTHYDLSGTIKPLYGDVDENFYLETPSGAAYIFKISPLDTDPAFLEMQFQALQHLAQTIPELQLPKAVQNNRQTPLVELKDAQGQTRFLRVLTWIPGKLWAQTFPHSPELLESLGKTCGLLSKGFQNFDHPAAHRWFKWDPSQVAWTKDHIHLLDENTQAPLATYFHSLIEEQASPLLPQLRTSVNHNDANDYNLLVNIQNPYHHTVQSLIDFGDMVYTHTVNELAVAAAYALMDQADPLSALIPLVRAYHEEFPLTDTEVRVLFPMITARLLITITSAALTRQSDPDSAYHFISEQPAWALLSRLREIPPKLVEYTLRYACGWEPCPVNNAFTQWTQSFSPLPISALCPTADGSIASIHTFDFSIGSRELGNHSRFEDPMRFTQWIQRRLEEVGAQIGIGKYLEHRPFYLSDAYQSPGNEGPQWRTLHLGLDVFLPAGNPVLAPLEGVVFQFADNGGNYNYGPTLILKHTPTPELTFYTLYGHLSRTSMDHWEVGKRYAPGQTIGTLGEVEENGGWPPHLHFQIILDPLDMHGDFPGLAYPQHQDIWKSICPDPTVLFQFPPSSLPDSPLPFAQLLQTRKNHLGPSLSLSYREPLHIVRGYRQYLYDPHGRKYLDTANNVPHVGHQHPRVVEAAQQQIAVLNTNTRYLHEEILAYAEELYEKLPPQLEVIHLVNSGSEANELALRMARTCTQQQDFLVLDVGYHGNTNACIEVSSYKFDGPGGGGCPEHVHVLPMPDPYRGPYGLDDPEAGPKYAQAALPFIEKLATVGKGIAGFMGESILSCGGQIVPPPGYLQALYEHIRAVGGVCIADEVQTGFGRVGSHFWAFELQGVVPDILTMGKPIGNGHPLGAVACTRAVADAFANGMEYFNTFGGNPVSATIGRTVLAVIKEEGLQQQAYDVGNYLREGLLELQTRYPIIGEVRGPGLFQGVELVRDRATLAPAGQETSYLANRMRKLGILMGTDGPFHNVLKIKPPMVFDEHNVNQLLNTLDQVLKEDFLQIS